MSDTTNTSDLQALLDGYFECWNATDDAARSDAIRRTWAPDAQSSDPIADVAGHDQLAEMFAGFHATYPGVRSVRRAASTPTTTWCGGVGR